MQISEEDSKFLAKQMGLCWHEWEFISSYALCADESDYKCKICGKFKSTDNRPDFTTWEGFGKVKEFIDSQTWEREFYEWLEERGLARVEDGFRFLSNGLIGPALIPEVVKFLRERKEKKDA